MPELTVDMPNGQQVDLSTEYTPPQVILGYIDIIDNRLTRTRAQSPAWYRKIRAMRLDPTIALARLIAAAPLLISNWSVEKESTAPDGAQDLIAKNFIPMRTSIVQSAFYGRLDFGWQGYEKVIDYDAESGANILCKLKPLIQDRTDILVDSANGNFAGLRHTSTWGDVFNLPQQKTLLINKDAEAGELYGQGAMAACEMPYDKWHEAELAAARYDRKMAGAHWVIGYPLGTTEIRGIETDNSEVAAMIADHLQSSGTVCIPTTLSAITDSLNEQAPKGSELWYVRLETDAGGQTNFIERMKYLDALKVRALGFPERAILEGQFGTKAEADTHGDLAILAMEAQHNDIVRQVNWHAVNQILALNYGPKAENSVYLKASPIADTDMAFLRELYVKLLTTDVGALEAHSVDLEALKDRLGIPIKPENDVDAPGIYDPAQGLDDDDDYDSEIDLPESTELSLSWVTLQNGVHVEIGDDGQPVGGPIAHTKINGAHAMAQHAHGKAMETSKFASDKANRGTKAKHKEIAKRFKAVKDLHKQTAEAYREAGDHANAAVAEHNARQASSLASHHTNVARGMQR